MSSGSMVYFQKTFVPVLAIMMILVFAYSCFISYSIIVLTSHQKEEAGVLAAADKFRLLMPTHFQYGGSGGGAR